MESPHKGATGLQRIVNATRYSVAGLSAAVRGEAAFRQELIATAILVPLALWLGETGAQRAILIGSLLLVLIVELVNSAIEATVDRISPEQHDLAKRATALGSAAVMLALANVALVWAFVLFG